MDQQTFKNLYLGSFEPTERDQKLWEFAKRYHEETEAFDRTRCTGPIGKDGGILPANSYQMREISKNAYQVRRRIFEEAEKQGFGRNEVRKAISNYFNKR